MNIRTKNLLLTALALIISNSVYAVGSGLYFGTNLGVTNLHNKNQTIQFDDIGDTVSSQADNNGFGIRLFLGYNVNPYAAWELGFSHYGSTTYGGIPTFIAANKPSVHEYGFDTEVKGIMPVSKFGVYGKLGVAYLRKSDSGSLASCKPTDANPFPCSLTSSLTTGTQANAFRPLLGIGVSYDLSQNWVADLSGTRVTKGSGIQSADFFALGISYHVVDEYCGQFLC
jgi:opacity protein-like surface antigen